MYDALMQGGFIMYPLFVATAVAIGYGGAALRGLRLATGPDPRLQATIDGVLFWGGFGVVLGVIGTLVGIVQAARAIELAGGVVQPTLIWGGIRVALVPTIFALPVFALTALVWFLLRHRYRQQNA